MLSKQQYFHCKLRKKAKSSKFIRVNNTYWEKLGNCYSRHEIVPQAYTQFCNKHDVNTSLMWDDQYLKNTLQITSRNSAELTSVLAETLKTVFVSLLQK